MFLLIFSFRSDNSGRITSNWVATDKGWASFFFSALFQRLVDGVLASVSGNVSSTPFWDGFHHGACLKGFRLSPTSAEAWNYCRDEWE